jgi:hypothetical protein
MIKFHHFQGLISLDYFFTFEKTCLAMKAKKLTVLVLLFVFMVPIGTVSHEYGHIIVAKYLGYSTKLHYGSMNLIRKDKNYSKDTRIEKTDHHSFLITLGGPIQTILTGSIGFFLILYRRQKGKHLKLGSLNWLLIFLSLFWLREVFNLIISFVSEIINPDGSYFGGDEAWISDYLGLNRGVIPISLGLIGSAIFLFIFFKILPTKVRVPFVFACVVGCLLGYYLWMYLLGPKILP